MVTFRFSINYCFNLIFLYNANPIGVIISLSFIVFPVKGLKIMEVIFSSLGNRQYMIYFPTELAILAKGRFNHQSTASIFPEFIRIRSNYGLSFCPNGFNNGGFKWLAKFIRIPFPLHVQLPLFIALRFLPSGYYGSFFYLGFGSASILIIIDQFTTLVRAFLFCKFFL